MRKTRAPDSAAKKLLRLEEILRVLGRVVVCFSGGVDSSLLAAAAVRVLGPENALLFHARSLFTPGLEESFAADLAARLGAEIHVFDADVLASDEIRRNDVLRCYHCKRMILREAKKHALSRGVDVVADGSNADDALDHRPGARAVAEEGVRSPLAEAGLTKREIVALARAAGLPNWSLPASACNATRIPHGVPLDEKSLRMVAWAESFLASNGVMGSRVRLIGGEARVEVAPRLFPRVARMSGKIVEEFRRLGFGEVLLDLQGYRKGVFNPPTSDARK